MEPAGSGLRSGAAIDVLRSWCPRGTVVTGRCGLEAWLDPPRADASAADKRGYEEFRFRLAEETSWRQPAGEYSLRDIVAAVTASTGTKSLLDPDVAEVRVRAEPMESLLRILKQDVGGEDPRFGWTWAAHLLVVTGPE